MSREAMKQALEALEYDSRPETEYGINSAITILRQAIEEAEKQERETNETKAWFTIDEFNEWAEKLIEREKTNASPTTEA